MSIAVFPFTAHVAEATGRMLRLQGEVSASQVNRRIRERFGDRHYVHRSVRYTLSTFLDFGALTAGEKRGEYLPGKILRSGSSEELNWIVESLLYSRDESNIPLNHINQHTALFPFTIGHLSSSTLRSNPRVEIFRHGMAEELVGLAN